MKSWQLNEWEVLTGHIAEFPVNVVLAAQVHGANIIAVDEFLSTRPTADALSTTGKVIVGVLTADCLPLVLTTPSVALIIHVSRASLTAGILDRVGNFIQLRDLSGVFLGAHICEQHLTYSHLGPELQEFAKKFGPALKGDSPYTISLRAIVHNYLKQWGKESLVILEDGRCTFEDPELYSHRRALLEKSSAPLPRFITAVRRQAA
ncbi:MAG: polyphenol oxidase family protein [Candidatus Andersenbacteria bacterium]